MPGEESKAKILADLIGKGGDQDHPALVSGFLSRSKVLIMPRSDYEEIAQVQEEIKTLCTAYRDYRREHMVKMQAAMQGAKREHQDASMLKSKAESILKGLYKSLWEFLSCELELSTTIAALDMEIRSVGGDPDKAKILPVSLLSSDLPVQVAVAIRRRGILNAEIARMQKVEAIVNMIEAVLTYIEISVTELMTPEKAKPLLDNFSKNFRKMKFPQATNLVSEMARKETGRFFMRKKRFKRGRWKFMLEVVEILVALATKFRAELRKEGDDIFLKKKELHQALEYNQKQLQITMDFLEKYRVPEIRMRRDALERQLEKIHKEVGTLQSYHKLIEDIERACCTPMTTLKETSEFESGLLKQANRTIEEKSVEIQRFVEFIREKAKNPDPENVSDSDLASMQLKTD